MRTLAAAFAVALAAATAAPAADKPNVLFISVDDLRPQLGCYGESMMRTPHIDRLASQARLFNRHYVQAPTCGASRFSMLTSTRPSRTDALRNWVFKRLHQDTEPERPVSWPHLFKQNGYRTVNIGKISHNPDGHLRKKTMKRDVPPRSEVPLELPFSWHKAFVPTGPWDAPWRAFFAYEGGKTRHRGQTPPYEITPGGDDVYPDGLIADAAVEELRRLKGDRFLLAVGFFKPHLPFNMPEKYWDMYDPDEVDLPPNPDPPKNLDKKFSIHGSGEFNGGYSEPSTKNMTEQQVRTLRRAYYACVSYTDAQVGKVLDALDDLGLADETIVVLWGDHGWMLGNHGMWGKHSTFEQAVQSPLIVRVPGMNEPGAKTDALAESADIYPTLADLCGLDAPDDLTGRSLRPALDEPDHPGKTAAISYWRGGGHRARSVRTDRYRLVRWAKDGDIGEVELYDHKNDPLETANLAKRKPDVRQRLLKIAERDAPRMRDNR